MAWIPWFHLLPVHNGVDDDYESHFVYAFDGWFFSYVTGDVLCRRAFRDVYAVDDVTLQTARITFYKCVFHFLNLRRGVELYLFWGQSIDPEIEMDLWT